MKYLPANLFPPKPCMIPPTLGLERIQRLLKALGNPQQALPPVIHLAGTNGKGSTSAFLQSILRASGYGVHTYTSPHLVRLNERISLNGNPISDEFLEACLEDCRQANRDQPISWFELTTAAAFVAFSRTPSACVILETGLGGRLDATNVIEKPLVTALTSISTDHQDFLGETLAEIAREKAGIFKEGVPAVTCAQPPEVLDVLRQASQVKSVSLACQGVDWDISADQACEDRLTFSWRGQNTWTVPLPPLPGAHQVENLGVALATLKRAEKTFKITPDGLNEGIQKTHWPGRLQHVSSSHPWQNLFSTETQIWIDGAHNPAAAQALGAYLATWSPKPVVIWGMMRSKNPTDFLKALKNQATQILTVPISGEDCYTPQELSDLAQERGFQTRPFPSLYQALTSLSAQKNPRPQKILICGSLYLVGEALESAAALL